MGQTVTSVVAGADVSAHATAAEALTYAVAHQRQCVMAGTPTKIGVHTADDADAAARGAAGLAVTAATGQIRVSAATAMVVNDSLPEAVRLMECDRQRFNGGERPQAVFQVVATGLPWDFETARTGPWATTSFVGRVADRDQVGAQLAEHRTVTLLGAGGCGKSRLGEEVAQAVRTGYEDAVTVDLAAIADPGVVASALAQVLGITEAPLQNVVDLIVNGIADRAVLIVLDNCEHVAAAAAELVDAIVAGCPRATVIVTSREPLGADHEVPWRVPSLSIPDDDTDDLPRLLESDAARLFIDRAVSAGADLRLDRTGCAAVARICRDLDGIPLAIELAAARAGSVAIEAIATSLHEHLAAAAPEGTAGLARHQNLHASIRWSYEHLTPAEGALFRRLSAFAGTFTAAAVVAVCGATGTPDDPTDRLLARLVQRSMVQAVRTPDETRYRLLETLRQFAAGLTAASGEATALRAAHLNYFLAVVEEAHASGDAGKVGALQADLDNLRHAIDWAVAGGDGPAAMRLTAGLFMCWWTRGMLAEASARLTTALGLDSRGEPAARAAALIAAARTSIGLLDPEAIRVYAEEAVTIGTVLGDDRIVGQALVSLGWRAAFLDPVAGRDIYQRAATAARAAGDLWHLSEALNGLAFLEAVAGHRDASRQLFEEALAISRDTLLPFQACAVLSWYGITCGLWCDFAESAHLLEEAVESGRAHHDPYFVTLSLAFDGMTRVRAGDFDGADTRTAEAATLAERQGFLGAMTAIATARTEAAYARGELATARDAAEQALLLLKAAGWRFGIAWITTSMGAIARERGDVDVARAHFQHALTTAREIECPREESRALAGLATVATETDEAASLARWAIRAAHSAGMPLETIEAIEVLAAFLPPEESVFLAAAADTARVALGAPRYPIAKARWEQQLADRREALGDSFAEAWAAGAELDVAAAADRATRNQGGSRGRPSVGWDSLTPAEQRVVRLVTEGLTNPQIADRLFITSGTVRIHLSNIFRKVGVATRSALAAEAARRDFAAH